MHRPVPVLFALTGVLSVACLTRPNPAFNDEAESSAAGSTETTGTTTDAVTTGLSSETGTPTTTTTSEASTGTSTIGDPSTTDATSTGLVTATTSTGESTGDTTTGGEAPATCAEARDLGLGVPRGVVELAVPDQPGATLEVWCEQEVAGGGWLLVGRSSAGAPPQSFGWGHSSGDIGDDSSAYSLDLLANKFPASELLIGTYQRGKQLGSYAFSLRTPEGFPSKYSFMVGATSEVKRVLGECDPEGGPKMLKYVGFILAGNRFHLRDVLLDDNYGLHAYGFTLNNDMCENSGEMHEDQGMIFAR